MTNKEFYKDELLDLFLQGERIALYHGKLMPCLSTKCENCDWSIQEDTDCDERLNEWLNKEYEPMVRVFNPQIGEDYYWIDNEYKVRRACFVYDSVDRKFQKNGNACTDRGYMEKRAKEIKLYNLLSNFAYQVNEGWEPDLDSNTEYSWYIYKIGSDWATIEVVQEHYITGVAFRTEKLADRAIEEIILPFERGEL